MYDSSMSDTGPLVETAVSDQETETRADPEISRAKEQLALARERMLSAALAFCDGTISAGQLRAVRELLREQDLRLTQLEGETPPVFVEDMAVEEFVSEDSLTERSIEETLKMEIETQDAPELMEMLSNIDEKIERLEDDFENGRINGSQYRAIRRHYQEQREVAMRLKEAHPSSDRWRVTETRSSYKAKCRMLLKRRWASSARSDRPARNPGQAACLPLIWMMAQVCCSFPASTQRYWRCFHRIPLDGRYGR
jgi:hypothetical protein